jgi:hypothetical protein
MPVHTTKAPTRPTKRSVDITELEQLAARLMLSHNSPEDPDTVAFIRTHCAPNFRMMDKDAHEVSHCNDQKLCTVHNVSVRAHYHHATLSISTLPTLLP